MSRPSGLRTYYIPGPMLAEIEAEAQRLDRSVSWVMRRAWQRARRRIVAMESPRAHGPPSEGTP